MKIHRIGEDGLISGSNRNVEFQAILNVPSLDLTPISHEEEDDDLDHDFRGAPYSYLYEDNKGNRISVRGWYAKSVLKISNFFLKYLDKSIGYEVIKLNKKVR